jgi:DNA invertase Pin-like site-specific DNA recombinase
MTVKGYVRIARTDGRAALESQRRALHEAGVPEKNIYSDTASGKWDKRPGLEACLKGLQPDDTLVVWKLDRLCRNLTQLVTTINALMERNVGLRVLSGKGAALDTASHASRCVIDVFSALAEFERGLKSESGRVGRLGAVRNRGRNPTMTPEKLRLAASALGKRGTVVSELCRELGINRSTLYRYMLPTGELRARGKKVLETAGHAKDGKSSKIASRRPVPEEK